jgi:hypothetical protein
MDEGAFGMTTTGNDDSAEVKAESPPETPAQLEEEIEGIRNHLSDVVGELDRRRHRLLDVPGHIRRNAKPIVVGTAALVALGAGLWWWRARRQQTVAGRMGSLLPKTIASGEWFDDVRGRVAQVIHPEPPSHPFRGALLKIGTAGLGAAASVLARQLAMKFAKGRPPKGPTERENTLTSFAR